MLICEHQVSVPASPGNQSQSECDEDDDPLRDSQEEGTGRKVNIEYANQQGPESMAALPFVVAALPLVRALVFLVVVAAGT